MTAEDILAFVSDRGTDLSQADVATMNGMLVELPLEEVSDVRAWAIEAMALIVNDPLYEGDVPPID